MQYRSRDRDRISAQRRDRVPRASFMYGAYTHIQSDARSRRNADLLDEWPLTPFSRASALSFAVVSLLFTPAMHSGTLVESRPSVSAS